MTPPLIVLTGCSGGGKSSILAELERRGHRCVPEPGRRVVARSHELGANTLPWVSPSAFAEACVDLHLKDLADLEDGPDPVFLDRSLIDAVSYLPFKNLPVPPHLHCLPDEIRYWPQVFVTPPWPEIFRNDAERKGSLKDAEAEYCSLRNAYEALGYELVDVPKGLISDRATFIEKQLSHVPG